MDKFDINFIGWQEFKQGKIDNLIFWNDFKKVKFRGTIKQNLIWTFVFHTLKYMYGTYIITNYKPSFREQIMSKIENMIALVRFILGYQFFPFQKLKILKFINCNRWRDNISEIEYSSDRESLYKNL